MGDLGDVKEREGDILDDGKFSGIPREAERREDFNLGDGKFSGFPREAERREAEYMARSK